MWNSVGPYAISMSLHLSTCLFIWYTHFLSHLLPSCRFELSIRPYYPNSTQWPGLRSAARQIWTSQTWHTQSVQQREMLVTNARTPDKKGLERQDLRSGKANHLSILHNECRTSFFYRPFFSQPGFGIFTPGASNARRSHSFPLRLFSLTNRYSYNCL